LSETSGFEYEITTIIYSVVFFLVLSMIIRGVIADGLIKSNEVTDPIKDFGNNVTLDVASYNLSALEQVSVFQPPICVGYIPIISDIGCSGAFILWLIGLERLSTEFVWINYLIVLPLSIVVGFTIGRFIKP
jgi:hypothetical protein